MAKEETKPASPKLIKPGEYVAARKKKKLAKK